MALSDDDVDTIEDFVLTHPLAKVNGKYIANHVFIGLAECAFVLAELHYDGVLDKRGTYYSRDAYDG